jgi:hypothetical protein
LSLSAVKISFSLHHSKKADSHSKDKAAKQVEWAKHDTFKTHILRLGGFHTMSCFVASISKRQLCKKIHNHYQNLLISVCVLQTVENNNKLNKLFTSKVTKVKHSLTSNASNKSGFYAEILPIR